MGGGSGGPSGGAVAGLSVAPRSVMSTRAPPGALERFGRRLGALTDQSTAATKRWRPSVTPGPPLSSLHFCRMSASTTSMAPASCSRTSPTCCCTPSMALACDRRLRKGQHGWARVGSQPAAAAATAAVAAVAAPPGQIGAQAISTRLPMHCACCRALHWPPERARALHSPLSCVQARWRTKEVTMMRTGTPRLGIAIHGCNSSGSLDSGLLCRAAHSAHAIPQTGRTRSLDSHAGNDSPASDRWCAPKNRAARPGRNLCPSPPQLVHTSAPTPCCCCPVCVPQPPSALPATSRRRRPRRQRQRRAAVGDGRGRLCSRAAVHGCVHIAEAS